MYMPIEKNLKKPSKQIKNKTPKNKTPKNKTPKNKTPKKSDTPKKQKPKNKKRTPKNTPVIIPTRASIRKRPVLFGHIYSNSCGHCVHMQPEWDKLCRQVKDVQLRDIGDNYDSEIANINQTFGTNIQYSGFPTIFRVVEPNKPVEYYQGERTAPMMKQWLYS